MSEITFGAKAAKVAKKSRYTLASNAVATDPGCKVGMAVDQNEIPWLVHDRVTIQEAIQLNAVQTAFTDGAIPLDQVVALFKGAGKLAELEKAIAADKNAK